MVIEQNQAKRLILKPFEAVIDFLMHNAGLYRLTRLFIMMKYLLSLSFLCLSAWLFAQNPTGLKVIPERIYNMEKSAWSFEEVQPFKNTVGPERLDIPIELTLDAWGLQPDMAVLENIANNKPTALDVVIPVPNQPSMVVRVHRVEITAEDMMTEYARLLINMQHLGD